MTERREMFSIKQIMGEGMDGKDGWVSLGFRNEKSPKTRAISTKKGLDSALLLC
jgi:hypothetical protein